MRYELSRKVMTVKEMADYLGVHSSTIYKLLKKHQIPGFRVGSDWRFNVEEVDRWRLAQPTALRK